MILATTYICVNDIEKSLNFYKKVLDKEPSYSNDDRWISFDVGNSIALYNKSYDEKILKNKECFNKAYIEDFKKEKEHINNIMILNFIVDDLLKEYERLKSLNIEVSDIMYVNVHQPYWYFNVTDPDGNILEITGNYIED